MKKDLKKPLVPLKVAKASLELHLETIPVRVGPGRVGPGRVGPGRVGPIVILRLTQSSCAGAGTELGKKRKNNGGNSDNQLQGQPLVAIYKIGVICSHESFFEGLKGRTNKY